ncbi:RIIa domain-containing protein 1 isoform X2 [Cuculus canorus]|uniref:RIIa domain-containing protein 1 isoform X2 n=1 Tax=Cuculus canorus TaxID=55661 RepID=UPI0023AA5409|nr:RIIa domain-containing protein 1 isoform X2 [Cuculus canorus]
MAPPQPRQAVFRASTQRFLRAHPTVERLLRGFFRELLLRRPENVLEFAAEYFTNPELPRQIQEELGGPGAAEEGQRPAPHPGGM